MQQAFQKNKLMKFQNPKYYNKKKKQYISTAIYLNYSVNEVVAF